MSSMTGPVSGAKGKKNWEQLQQENDTSEGVQVGHHVTTQSDDNDDDASGSDNAEEGWQGRGRGEERAGGQ